ncbi:MAG: HAD hydrolase family protein, partial [Anaerolineae bacterium]|nr:HAD hydrolase family protein [Anaerolineae bacterium]
MFKLIALDVDGTLLNSQHALTPGTADAIAAARRQGVKVILATGRQYVAIQDLVTQMN